MVTLSQQDVDDVIETRLILLGIPPSEVDTMPYDQAMRVLEMARANREIDAYRMQKMIKR